MTAVATELPPTMLGRATLILDAFDRPDRRLSLGQVAASTGLPRSTAHRILDQLVAQRWVARTEAGYALGERARAWAGPGGGGNTRLREAAAPVLHELAVQTAGVVQLGVLEGAGHDEVSLLDKVGGRLAAQLPTRVGVLVPAGSSTLGRALLGGGVAHSSDEYGASVVAVAAAITDRAALELVLPGAAPGPTHEALVRRAAARIRSALT